MTLAIHVGYWAALWRFHDRSEWTPGALGDWFVSVATLFVASRLLVPTVTSSLNMRRHFPAIRKPFFGALTLFWLLASTGPWFLSSPWLTPHRPFVVSFALLSLSGALVSSERYQSALVLIWSLLYVVNWALFQAPIA